MCCGKKARSGWSVTFLWRHTDAELETAYGLKAFRTHSLAIKCLFQKTHMFMDLSYTEGGPSFLRMQGNGSIAMPVPESRYSFLGQRGLQVRIQTITGDVSFAPHCDVRKSEMSWICYIGPICTGCMKPRPHIVRETFRNIIAKSRTAFQQEQQKGGT